MFGILACCGNDPEAAIVAAVNIGNDTDTVATMVGSIVGALHGIEALPHNYLPVLNKANECELEELADRVLQLHDLENSSNSFIPKAMLQ